ncbi:hypothetical protein [Caenispirillum bisanense]|uniref:hypothetical protein n=1 Tax=Caenispirillum bisanense TaxID=414052 RepID=UPI0031D7C433
MVSHQRNSRDRSVMLRRRPRTATAAPVRLALIIVAAALVAVAQAVLIVPVAYDERPAYSPATATRQGGASPSQ